MLRQTVLKSAKLYFCHRSKTSYSQLVGLSVCTQIDKERAPTNQKSSKKKKKVLRRTSWINM